MPASLLSTELMKALDYDDREQFNQVILAAMRVCQALDMPVRHHFKSIFISREAGIEQELKLSELACYFIVLNADPAHPAVAQAQYYFIKDKI
jgi:hypothetical protein